MTDVTDRLRRTAYHEGGHAIAAWVLGIEVEGASIEPDGNSLGRVLYNGIEDAQLYDETLHRYLISLYAGVTAVEVLAGQPIDPDNVNMDPTVTGTDWNKVVGAVLSIAGPDEVEQLALQELAQREAQRTLHNNWRGVEAVAEALLEHRSLDSSHLSRILKDAGCPRGEPDYEYEIEQLHSRRFSLAIRYQELISVGRQEEAEDVALEVNRVQSKVEELQSLAERQLEQRRG